MPFLKNTWYVAAWSHEVTDQLFARRILDQPVLIYRKLNGDAVAIEDRCPHRFAPLHLGRQKGNNIECGYHGLQYGPDGECVLNPHGDGKIPKGCRVKSYPLVERYGIFWIWPGAADKADPARIHDFSHLVERGTKTVHGGTLVRANYELITDNLMDASHTQYVHEDLLGTEAFARSRHEVRNDGAAIHSTYLIPNSSVPAAYRDYFDPAVQVVDYAVDFRWQPPALVRNSVSLTPVGEVIAEAIHRTGTHLMTPETETTTHYFFSHTRNFQLDDVRVDERIRRWQKLGLSDQDKPMIEACQQMMGDVTNLNSLKPLLFSIDTAAVRVRRQVQSLLQDEQSGTRAAA